MAKEKALAVVVNGVSMGKAFTEEIKFELEASEAFKYGNGLMLIVHRPKWGETEAVDVRYSKTKDIKVLADTWLKNFFGENLKSYEVKA